MGSKREKEPDLGLAFASGEFCEAQLAWKVFLAGGCRWVSLAKLRGAAEERETMEIVQAPSVGTVRPKPARESSEAEDGSKHSWPSCKTFSGQTHFCHQMSI